MFLFINLVFFAHLNEVMWYKLNALLEKKIDTFCLDVLEGFEANKVCAMPGKGLISMCSFHFLCSGPAVLF